MFRSSFLSRIKRKYSLYLFLVKPVTLIVGFILAILLIIKIALPQINKQIFKLLFFTNAKSNGSLRQTDQTTNILVMGVSGGNHDGPDLTDSLIIASLNLKSKNMHLVTVPRDLWIEELHGKINSAYHLGESKSKGTGIVLSKATVGEVLGIPIHYGVLIDFHAFSSIVDQFGGVDLTIDNAFDDFEYPIEGKENELCGKDKEEEQKVTDQNIAKIFPCRFEHLHFDKGATHFNGETALKFVRSRHAQGDEGTDFARSKRQLKLIEAIKTKINKPQLFLNPAFLLKMSSDLQKNIDTDLPTNQILFLARQFMNTKISDIKTMTLDWGTKENPGLLYNPPLADFDGVWVLLPRSGNWEDIQKQVKQFLQI